MKLVRYGQVGKEKPGLIDAQGKLRDLSSVIKDVTPDQLSDKALAKLAKVKIDKLPLVRGKPRMGCPVAQIGKFIAIGLNYADHAAESNMPIPKEPIVFMKTTSCIQGPDDDVMRLGSRTRYRDRHPCPLCLAKRRIRLCGRLLHHQ
jgi:2-keto-4-pentenoate hydratase/2-oxohepta-3-ene-1,7-dioic acid hydratase in catechol pathway